MDLILSALRVLTFRTVYPAQTANPAAAATATTTTTTTTTTAAGSEDSVTPAAENPDAAAGSCPIEKQQEQLVDKPVKRTRKTLAGSRVSAPPARVDESAAAPKWRPTLAPLPQSEQPPPPLQLLYEKLLMVAQPFSWDAAGCYLTNVGKRPGSDYGSASFQIVCSGYLINVVIRVPGSPGTPLEVTCDPAVPALAPLWAELARDPERADRFLVDSILPAFAGALAGC